MGFEIPLPKAGEIWQAVVGYLSDKTWLQALQNLLSGWDLMKSRNPKGMYEVLEYEATLELKDIKGKKALVSKRERVRYLQDNVIAFQDQAWGDGKILQNYRCSPGVAIDMYRSGYKTIILISRREVKMRGDIDEFRIDWGIRQGFLKPTGFWAAEINHTTGNIKMRVIFPRTRPPVKAAVLEKNRQQTTSLGESNFLNLPGGKREIVWENSKPQLFEQYILSWEW